ncbi:MAG: hypothetical protein LLF94_11510 [Chlamydiales bacterium]|nr:hypothetical protein [Chlamydiales bacterium]
MNNIHPSLLNTVFTNINTHIEKTFPENRLFRWDSLSRFFRKALSQQMLTSMQNASIQLFNKNIWLIGEQEDKKVRSSLIKACCQVAVFSVSPLQPNTDAHTLTLWHKALAKRVDRLPDCALKNKVKILIRELELPFLRIETASRLVQNPCTRSFKPIALQCSQKARAFQSVQSLKQNWAQVVASTTSPLTKDKAVILPEIGVVVRARPAHNQDIEALTEKLMGISLSDACIPAWKPAEADEPLILKTLFPGIENKKISVSNYEGFVTFFDISHIPALQEHIIRKLDFEAQKSLHAMLALQPLDHHRANFGVRIAKSHPGYIEFQSMTQKQRIDFCTHLHRMLTDKEYVSVTCSAMYAFAQELPWEVVFFDNELSLASSNHVVSMIANTGKNLKKYSKLHLIPLQSCVVTMKSAHDPLSDKLIDALMNIHAIQDISSWLYKKPHLFYKKLHDVLGTAPAQKIKDICLDVLEKLESGRFHCYPKWHKIPLDTLCEELEKNTEFSAILTPERVAELEISKKSIIQSLTPRTTFYAYEMIKTRLVTRLEYLRICKEFKSNHDAASWRALFKIINHAKDLPIPSSIKHKVNLALQALAPNDDIEPIKSLLEPWFRPTLRSVTCAMYPLLADALVLYDALKMQRIIGNYLFPLESLVYLHLKPLCLGQRLTDLLVINISMQENTCSNPMLELQKIFQQLQVAKVPIAHEHELQNIINTTEKYRHPFTIEANAPLWDPDKLEEKYSKFYPKCYDY